MRDCCASVCAAPYSSRKIVREMLGELDRGCSRARIAIQTPKIMHALRPFMMTKRLSGTAMSRVADQQRWRSACSIRMTRSAHARQRRPMTRSCEARRQLDREPLDLDDLDLVQPAAVGEREPLQLVVGRARHRDCSAASLPRMKRRSPSRHSAHISRGWPAMLTIIQPSGSTLGSARRPRLR